MTLMDIFFYIPEVLLNSCLRYFDSPPLPIACLHPALLRSPFANYFTFSSSWWLHLLMLVVRGHNERRRQ
jgi:hypothetical protein